MAQIITLKDLLDKGTRLGASQFETGKDQDMPRGPAQLLFFTGVRYERYEDIGPQTAKLAKRSNRKKTLPH